VARCHSKLCYLQLIVHCKITFSTACLPDHVYRLRINKRDIINSQHVTSSSLSILLMKSSRCVFRRQLNLRFRHYSTVASNKNSRICIVAVAIDVTASCPSPHPLPKIWCPLDENFKLGLYMNHCHGDPVNIFFINKHNSLFRLLILFDVFDELELIC